MISLLKGQKKVKVLMLELNGDTPWKKYPIDASGCVLISMGGAGPKDLKENPELVPSAWFERRRPIQRWKKERYLIYPRLSKKFLIRGESTAPPVSLELIDLLLKAKAMKAYVGKNDMNTYSIIIMAMLAFVIFLLVG